MGVAAGVAVGAGVDVGSGVGVAVGSGVSVGSGVGVAVGSGVSVGSGVGVAVGSGVSVGDGVSVGAGVSVGDGDGVSVGAGVEFGSGVVVGAGVGVAFGSGSVFRPTVTRIVSATWLSLSGSPSCSSSHRLGEPATTAQMRSDPSTAPRYVAVQVAAPPVLQVRSGLLPLPPGSLALPLTK